MRQGPAASRLWKNHFGTAELRWPARLGQARSVWSIWFLWFVWLNKINQMNQTNQTDALGRLADFFTILLARIIHEDS
jgi:hypothetical protein